MAKIEVDGRFMNLDNFCQYDGEVTYMIRSGNITSYIDLSNWLLSKNLPFLERWSYYLSGNLGVYPDPYKKHYVYFWKEFLNLTAEDTKTIIDKYIAQIDNSDIQNLLDGDPLYFKRPKESYLPEENIYWGWKWVIDQINKENAEIQAGIEADRESESYDWYDPFEGHGNWGYGDGY